MKLIECVPNISEGRNEEIINQITNTIKSNPELHLLDVDPGFDTNRTVITFVGSPDHVIAGAFELIKKASELMTKNPTLADKKMLIGEAINIMNNKKITSLFVCAKKKPLGIIHIHDLLRLTS